MPETHALITDDAVVFGLLAATLGAVFWTAHSAHPVWRAFYKYVPALLLCYFIPALYNSFGLVDGELSKLYFVSSRSIRSPLRSSGLSYWRPPSACWLH